MRNLTVNEIKDMQALDGRRPDPGDQWVEATVTELATAGVQVSCCDSGGLAAGPLFFGTLAGKKKYHARKVRGCIHLRADASGNPQQHMSGLLAIKIQTEETAEKIEQLTGLRFDGPAKGSTLAGFMVFEDE